MTRRTASVAPSAPTVQAAAACAHARRPSANHRAPSLSCFGGRRPCPRTLCLQAPSLSCFGGRKPCPRAPCFRCRTTAFSLSRGTTSCSAPPTRCSPRGLRGLPRACEGVHMRMNGPGEAWQRRRLGQTD
eukprot:scaffold23658_cov61-Phaeocystis_antarctica.AAC.4